MSSGWGPVWDDEGGGEEGDFDSDQDEFFGGEETLEEEYSINDVQGNGEGTDQVSTEEDRGDEGRQQDRTATKPSRRNRPARFGQWTDRTWNLVKSWCLGPFFIGMALGMGVSMGRALFLVTMQRTTALLLGPQGASRFRIPS